MRGVLSPLQVVIAAEDSSPGKGMSSGGEGEERTGAEIRSHTLPRFSSSSLSEGAPSAQGEAWPRVHALRCRPWGAQ